MWGQIAGAAAGVGTSLLGGSSKNKTKQTSSTDQTIDPYSQDRIDTATANIRGILDDNPYQSYTDPRVAGLSGTQKTAREVAQPGSGELFGDAAARVGAGGDFVSGTVGAATIPGADLTAYTNPYEDMVIQQQQEDMRRDKAIADQQLAGQLTQAGAFGGDREAVMRAEQDRAYEDRIARETSNLRNAGYDRATSLYTADADRKLGADTFNVQTAANDADRNIRSGSTLAQIGGAEGADRRADAGLLEALGSEERSIEQGGLDAQYEDFLRKIEDDRYRVQTEMGLLSSTPVLVDSKSTGTTSQPKDWASILGGGASVAGGVMGLFG